MRVALLTQSCDNQTGIGRIVLSLARELSLLGNEIHVLAQHLYGLGQGVSGHRVMALSPYNSIRKLVYSFASAPVLKHVRCDVVDAFGVGREAQVVTAQSCHLAATELLRKSKGKRIWRRSWGLYDRVSLRDELRLFTSPHTRRIIAVSGRVKEEIVSYYTVPPDRITVIPNGVDYALLAGNTLRFSREEVRANLRLGADDYVWLFVGNEFDRKGLQTVIEALAQLRDSRDLLLVIGSDDAAPYQRLAARLMVEDRVRFLGGMPGPERLYMAADVFVFPTLYEAFGLVIIEAMAAGVPVITSRSAGAVEGMENTEHGLFLSEPRSANEVADAVRRLKEDGGLREHIRVKAREGASKFAWNVVAARTMDVFEQIQ